MMTSLALWWLVLSVLGWLIWPLAATLLRHTPGRGYGFARALGLLFLSYVLWLLVTVGLLPNNDASAWSVSGALGVAGLASWVCRRAEWLAYLRREWRHVLTVEALFLVVLLLYALYRAYDPAIAHTEQPMDFAFLNASLRTSSMPPEDPWLAGYPVSYYYFGYWTVAVLCRLTATPSGAGYNLGLAHTLALTVVGAYSFLDDAVRLSAHGTSLRPMVARAFAVIGGLALALASNLEGVFEATRARGLGTGGFYRWLGVPGLADAPVTGSWLPAGRWWWWRASRIITDQNVLGRTPTVITEFPAFSFILGDLHPHVMALPYGLLALGLAIELYLVGRSVAARTWWRRPVYWVAPLVYGALGFLNSWDLPTFLFIAVAATFVGRLPDNQPPVFLKPLYLKPQTDNSQPVTSNPLELGPWAGVSLLIWLVAGSLLLYFPFYLHLSSQAQGVGLAYYAKTPLRHYLLIWGLWLPPILADTFLTLRKLLAQGAYRGRTLLAVWAVVFLTPWLAAALLGGWGRLLLGLIPLFTSGPWLLLLLSALIAVLGADIWRLLSRAAGSPNQQPATSNPQLDPFQFLSRLLVLVGLGLTYATEFFYLRDLFDTRMNTVFKFYYQAWVLLGLGGVLAAYRLWRSGGWQRGLYTVYGALLLCVCLYYPLAAAYTRGDGYRGPPSLDATAFLKSDSPAEYGAYAWLRQHARLGDVLVEAAGEDFVADHDRLSSWTGVPAILGWPGHEEQWRGDDVEIRKRLLDLDTIYTSAQADEILRTLHQYSVTYLYIGPYEREKYGISSGRLEWYASFLETVYAEEDIRLYRLPER